MTPRERPTTRMIQRKHSRNFLTEKVRSVIHSYIHVLYTDCMVTPWPGLELDYEVEEEGSGRDKAYVVRVT